MRGSVIIIALSCNLPCQRNEDVFVEEKLRIHGAGGGGLDHGSIQPLKLVVIRILFPPRLSFGLSEEGNETMKRTMMSRYIVGSAPYSCRMATAARLSGMSVSPMVSRSPSSSTRAARKLVGSASQSGRVPLALPAQRWR